MRRISLRGNDITIWNLYNAPADSPRIAQFVITAGADRKDKAQTEPVAEFDERLWGAMVDYVTVGVDKRLMVMFRDGSGI